MVRLFHLFIWKCYCLNSDNVIVSPKIQGLLRDIAYCVTEKQEKSIALYYLQCQTLSLHATATRSVLSLARVGTERVKGNHLHIGTL